MQTLNSDGGALSEAYAACCDGETAVAVVVLVQWDGEHWTDESRNFMRANGLQNLEDGESSGLLADGDISSASVTLFNTNRRFSWLAGSEGDQALRTAMAGRAELFGIRVRLLVGYETATDVYEYVYLFSGIISDWTLDGAQETLTLNLDDMGKHYMQTRVSTPLRKGYRLDEWIAELADLGGIAEAERTIAKSLYTAPWAWAENESVVEELWRAAQADGGRVYWDQTGKMRFETLLAWVNRASVWTLTGDDFQNIVPEPRPQMLATHIVASWQARTLRDVTVVYTLDEPKIVGPGQSLSWDAKFSQPVYTLATQVKGEDYIFASVGGANLNDYATVTLSNQCAQRVTITVANTHGTLPLAMLLFQLKGVKLEGGPSQELTIAVSDAPLSQRTVRTLRGNPLIQSDAHARALASFLAERSSRIHPVWRIAGVPGIPQLEVGDRITFSDGYNVPTSRDGHVISINWTLAGGDFVQDLLVMDRDGLFAYEDYFVIGQTALGAGRAWH